MSLRDFNPTDDRPISLQNQPLGNGVGLESFHTVQPEDRDSGVTNTPKIVGAVAVALMIGVAGIALYAHSSSFMQPKPVLADSNLPSPTPPATPASQQQAATAPDANMPASVPAATPAPRAPSARNRSRERTTRRAPRRASEATETC